MSSVNDDIPVGPDPAVDFIRLDSNIIVTGSGESRRDVFASLQAAVLNLPDATLKVIDAAVPANPAYAVHRYNMAGAYQIAGEVLHAIHARAADATYVGYGKHTPERPALVLFVHLGPYDPTGILASALGNMLRTIWNEGPEQGVYMVVNRARLTPFPPQWLGGIHAGTCHIINDQSGDHDGTVIYRLYNPFAEQAGAQAYTPEPLTFTPHSKEYLTLLYSQQYVKLEKIAAATGTDVAAILGDQVLPQPIRTAIAATGPAGLPASTIGDLFFAYYGSHASASPAYEACVRERVRSGHLVERRAPGEDFVRYVYADHPVKTVAVIRGERPLAELAEFLQKVVGQDPRLTTACLEITGRGEQWTATVYDRPITARQAASPEGK